MRFTRFFAVPLFALFLLSTSQAVPPAATATSPAAMSPAARQEEYTVCQNFLGEKLWIWQKRLNLAEWKITLRLVRVTELKPKTLGNIHWDADSHTAEIHVLAPEDYRMTKPAMLADMEFTVVHELIHLELSSLPRSDASRSAEEHAVNQISEALLHLDRRQSGQN